MELWEVLLGEPEQAGDDPHRELEGELSHEVRLAVGHEAVDLLVDDGTDELGLPPGQCLLAECVRDQVPVRAVLGVVHPQDHVAHNHADTRVVRGGGEGLGIAQDARAVVVAVGDPSRLGLDPLGQDLRRDRMTLGDGGVAPLARERRPRVARRTGHDVVEGCKRVVLPRVRRCHGAVPPRVGPLSVRNVL